MPQSLSKIYLHLIVSTKNRMPMLIGSVREPLHRYTATVLESLGCHAILINSVEDHVHILFELARTVAVSAVVEEVKTATSKWLKTQPSIRPEFSWQSGYGVFSVGGSNRKHTVAALPGEFWSNTWLGLEPFRRRCLHLFHHRANRDRSSQLKQDVYVIFNGIDQDCVATEAFENRRRVPMQRFPHRSYEHRHAVLRAEDQMQVDFRQRLRHFRSPLQGLCLTRSYPGRWPGLT